MITSNLPIAGWEGELILSDFVLREDNSVFKIDESLGEGVAEIKRLVLVQDVTLNADFAFLMESRLGTRRKVAIPAPVEFTGSFELVVSERNQWLSKIIKGQGIQYKPVYFTLTIKSINDKNVGYVIDECYLRRFQNSIGANGTMRTRYEFVGLGINLYTRPEEE
jgi:hypothetical protein